MSATAPKERPSGLNSRPLTDSNRHLAALISGLWLPLFSHCQMHFFCDFLALLEGKSLDNQVGMMRFIHLTMPTVPIFLVYLNAFCVIETANARLATAITAQKYSMLATRVDC